MGNEVLPAVPYEGAQSRIAFVGLSGPLFYDFRYQASPTVADFGSSPNPVLAAPVSLMLLYDEIWFLTRSLCPENLRGSSFVRFLDENGALDDMDPVDARKWMDLNAGDNRAYQIIREEFFDHYKDVLRSTGVYWDNACDNHTHGLRVGPFKGVNANSAAFASLLFDLYVYDKLERPYVDLVTNPYLEKCLERSVFPAGKLSFSERLIGPRLINWQSPEGPYHPEIEDLRYHRYLEDYRKWLGQYNVKFDEREARERQEAVQREMYDEMKKALLQKLDNGLFVKNSALMLTKALLDIPSHGFAGHTLDAAEAIKKTLETKPLRWQGFLLDLDARKTSGKPG